MRFGQRAEPAFEFLALGAARAAEGLRGDRLHDGQRILDPVVELLDQEVMQHLAARDRGRHPHREGKPDQQQDAPDHAGDGEAPPQRADQRALRDAGGHRPSGQLGSRIARDQRRAFERYRRQGRLRLAEHLGIKRPRSLLADRLLRIGHAREVDAFAVED